MLTSIVWIFLFAGTSLAKPLHVYLTWQGNTSRTITVNYQTKEIAPISQVFYDTVTRSGDVSQYRNRAVGTSHQIEGLKDGRWIHRVQLTGLKPATTYYFVAGDGENGFSSENKLRTIPDGDQPIRFVTGGDMGTGPAARWLLELAGKQNPMFGLIGGDLAYADGRLSKMDSWDNWLANWEKLMVTPDGYMVPMVLAIGNHDVLGGFGQDPDKAPFYFGYFGQASRRSYFSLRFGKNVIIFILDSGHIVNHGGEQARWLERQMGKSLGIPFKFAVYHVPLYPSHRSYWGKRSFFGRWYWASIFDRYGLTAAFENHEHTFKRSKLLKHNRPDPNGTLYLGDGDFGVVPPRSVDNKLRWYLEKASSTPHFWSIEVSQSGVRYRAFNPIGDIIDNYSQTSRNRPQPK